MRVRAFPSNPGPSGWQAILPPRTPMAALDGDKACDVLIIGAGFAGLSAAQALHAKQPGLAVIVLEAGRIGDGPAGRNSGFMIDLPHDLASDDYGGGSAFDGPDVAGNRAAIDFAAQMQARYDMPAEALRKSGKVNGAASAKGHAHNLTYAGQLDAVGQSYELLDATQMRAMTGTDFYRSGLFTPGTAVIQPALYIQALGDGLARVGVTIFENSAVLELERGPD